MITVTTLYVYCPYCGTELETRRIPVPDGPERRVCSACGFIHWGNSKPTSGGIVVNEAGQVLLGRRSVEPRRNYWDIPGGFLEMGEDPRDGARRELKEETGLDVVPEHLIGVYVDKYEYGEGGYTLNFFYRCRILSGTPHPADDMSELHWFGPQELPADLAFDCARRALDDWRRSEQEKSAA